MGLDITVHKNVKELPKVKSWEDFDGKGFRAFLPIPEWKNRMANLENDMFYSSEDSEYVFGYSYSTHSWLRNKLARVLLAKPIDSFTTHDWEDGTPFAEFINFSDCEGCIDWEMSAKLYKDFSDWKEKMFEFYEVEYEHSEEGLFQKRYENWMNAFKTASENKGVVVYA